jgi:hypothetical protein
MRPAVLHIMQSVMLVRGQMLRVVLVLIMLLVFMPERQARARSRAGGQRGRFRARREQRRGVGEVAARARADAAEAGAAALGRLPLLREHERGRQRAAASVGALLGRGVEARRLEARKGGAGSHCGRVALARIPGAWRKRVKWNGRM